MNVVQVASTRIYPPTQGGDHRTHGLVSAFPAESWTVDRFCHGGLVTNHDLPELATTVEIDTNYREHRPLNPFHDLASISEGFFDVPNVAISTWLRLWPPRTLTRLLSATDVVLVEGPLHYPGVAALAEETPVVYSSHNVEANRYAPIRERLFGDRIHARIREIERWAVREAAGVICTSERDAETFRKEYGTPSAVHIAPNATYADRLIGEPKVINSPGHHDSDTQSLTTVFVGSNYGPNVQAVEELFRIANTVRRTVPEVEFLVVGDVCSAFERSPENVRLLGFVDDLQELLATSDVALNPVTSGGGSNVKMLEYFASGVPVVSTEFGCRGFDVTGGRELLIRDLDRFPEAIDELGDPDRRVQLARAALTYVREHHIWETVSRRLSTWCEELVEQQTARASPRN